MIRRLAGNEGDSPFVKVAWGLIILVVGVAIFGPTLSPHDPNLGDFQKLLQGPSSDHWLGTDNLGRDTLSRLIAGTRIAALAGLEATAVAIAVGVPIGITVGFVGGTIDRLVMRIDRLLHLDTLVAAITAMSGRHVDKACRLVAEGRRACGGTAGREPSSPQGRPAGRRGIGSR